MSIAGTWSALNYFLIGIFVVCSFMMLFQSYTRMFSLSVYILFIALFVVLIGFSILSNKELISLVGVFSFLFDIRLMYYTATSFSVFPEGDAYSQYTVLLFFSQSSHITKFAQSNFRNFATRIPSQYSEWPGFQAFALSFSRITNLPIFWTALIIPFILFGIWFVVSYAIIRRIFVNRNQKLPALSILSIAIAGALPTFELPLIFKYDFMAAILLLGIILLLFISWDEKLFQGSLLAVLLAVAIVVTHSLTAVFMLLTVLMLGITLLVSSFVPMLIPRLSSLVSQHRIRSSRIFQLPRLTAIIIMLIGSWWAFYASFAKAYAIADAPSLIGSFSLKFLSFSRVQGTSTASVLSSLTPRWLVQILHLRDDLLLGLLGLGLLMLVVWPAIFKRRFPNAKVLFSVAIVILVTELSGVLNFGDRSFLTLAPILGILAVIPVAVIASRKLTVGKICGFFLLLVFLFTVGLGFWGSSYAPVFLYSRTPTAYAFGEHPTDWSPVATFINYESPSTNASGPVCVLTNELFITTLVVPIQDLRVTYPYPNLIPRTGCIVIVYDSLTHFNSSYVTEPYVPLKATNASQGFSEFAFSDTLANGSDRLFNGGNVTIYLVN